MNLQLTMPGRTPWIWRRPDMKTDTLYKLFSWRGIGAVLKESVLICRDSWTETHTPLLPPDALESYRAALTDLLRQADGEDGWSLEELYGRCAALRVRFFGAETVERCMLADGAHPIDETPGGTDERGAMAAMLDSCDTVLCFVYDMRYASIADRETRAAAAQGKRVLFAASPETDGAFPTERVLRAAVPASARFFAAPGGAPDAADADAATAAALKNARVCVLCYGEAGLAACRLLTVPAAVRCVPETLPARALVTQFVTDGLCTVYVPAGFDPLPWVPMRRRTLASYRQLAALRARGIEPGARTIGELYDLAPELFVNVYDESGAALPEALRMRPERPDLRTFLAEREKRLTAYLNAQPGVRYVSGWFRAGTFAREEIPWDADGGAEGILAQAVTFDRRTEAQVRLAEGTALQPRRLAMAGKETAPFRLITNFLFFFTPRLAALYDHLREDRPQERLTAPVGHLDYLLRTEGGRREETFPLYAKACIAAKDDGTFLFLRRRAGGGTLTVNGRRLVWTAADVDPETPGETAVYTPLLSARDEAADPETYTRPVGEGRVNLVLAGDRLVCARDGDVLLPSVGAVVSLDRVKGLAFLASCGFAPETDGYFDVRGASLFLRLEPPEGIPAAEWKRVRWAYGGGMTLMENGKTTAGEGSLRREGWLSPLSRQTQESDVSRMTRHPRTAVGRTRGGRLFAVVFSGRTGVSLGADYEEMVRITRLLVPDAWDLMNVDGGGSSVLGFAVGRSFMEVSLPASSVESLAGMVRPVSSLLILRPGARPADA